MALARTDYTHEGKGYMGTGAGRFTDAMVATFRSSFLIVFIFCENKGARPEGRSIRNMRTEMNSNEMII